MGRKPIFKEPLTTAERKRRSRQKARIYPDISFDIVYADPPWQYSNQAPRKRDRIETHYQTMLLEDIRKLSFNTKKNAICYLWATNPLLPEALQTLGSWGFSYKSNMTWDKKVMGLGYWFRGQHELLLVGTKGSVTAPPPDKRLPSVYTCKRGKHSEKPLFVRDYLTDLYPDLVKLELFARVGMFREEYERKSWYFWGDDC
jgi:N6-adenosine-specific RNA methylase IME4